MKSQKIWIWKKGAIEAHLGIESKNESAWALFKTNIKNNGLSNTCSDYQSIVDLIDWLRS